MSELVTNQELWPKLAALLGMEEKNVQECTIHLVGGEPPRITLKKTIRKGNDFEVETGLYELRKVEAKSDLAPKGENGLVETTGLSDQWRTYAPPFGPEVEKLKQWAAVHNAGLVTRNEIAQREGQEPESEVTT